MKRLKLTILLTSLVLTFLGCNKTHNSQDNNLLDEDRNWYKNSNNPYSQKKKTDEWIQKVEKLNKNKKANTSSTNYKLTKENKNWINQVNYLRQFKEGETIILNQHLELWGESKAPSDGMLNIGVDPEGYVKSQKASMPSLEDFEYNSNWRQEAYKKAKSYIVSKIAKEEGCKVISQGTYQPNLVRYLGGYTFLVRTYCEFDCNKGTNNPSYFWVQMTYRGNNNWGGTLEKQKFVN